MKRICTFLAAVLITVGVFAQSPEKMSYQSVIRDSNERLVTNQYISIRISILQGSLTGAEVYTETHDATSNANGLVSLEIGTGTTSDDFSSIDWANGPYFIYSESDLSEGLGYTISGTSQLLSVPYALHAKTAENTNEVDPAFTSSQAANISSADITNLNNLSGTNTGDQDLSGYVSTEADPVFSGSQSANITTADISHLGNLSGINTGDQDLSALATEVALSDSISSLRSELGGITSESDPVYSSSEAASITSSDIVNLGNLSGNNTGDQDGSETIINGGTNVNISGQGTIGNPYVINASGTGTLVSIGDTYGGGIVFWMDASGQHGLIAAASDQSGAIQWYNGTYTNTGATLDAVYAGRENTERIVASQGSGTYAARLCADYSVVVNNEYYDDWYLPSLYELNLLYQQKDVVGGFEVASYWSSTEENSSNAWMQGMNSAIQLMFQKDGAYHVRAIRAF